MIAFIEPVKGIRETADRVEIRVINYELNQPFQTLYFCLQNQFNRHIEEGNLVIPEPIVASWAEDDSVIVDWAIETLGLTQREAPVEAPNPMPVIPTPEEMVAEVLASNDLPTA
ncbi:MAG: hypothetical protein WCJ62_07795 [Flavobacterium sp.]